MADAEAELTSRREQLQTALNALAADAEALGVKVEVDSYTFGLYVGANGKVMSNRFTIHLTKRL